MGREYLEAVKRMRRGTLSAAGFAVLWPLADMAGRDGTCWPRPGWLELCCKLTRAGMKKGVDDLVAAGVARRVEIDGRRGFALDLRAMMGCGETGSEDHEWVFTRTVPGC